MKALAALAAVFIPMLTSSAKAISCNGVNYLAVDDRYGPMLISSRTQGVSDNVLGPLLLPREKVFTERFSYPEYEKICISSLV